MGTGVLDKNSRKKLTTLAEDSLNLLPVIDGTTLCVIDTKTGCFTEIIVRSRYKAITMMGKYLQKAPQNVNVKKILGKTFSFIARGKTLVSSGDKFVENILNPFFTHLGKSRTTSPSRFLFKKLRDGMADKFRDRGIYIVPLKLPVNNLVALHYFAKEGGLFRVSEKNTIDAFVRSSSYILESVYSMTSLKDEIKKKSAAAGRLDLNEKHLRLMLDNAPDGIYIIDTMGTFLYGNKRAEKLIGFKKQDLLGKSFLKLKGLLPKEDLLKAAKILSRNILGRGTGPHELNLNTPGGQITIEFNTFPFKIDNKKYIMGMARETTKRKLIERKLEQALDKLAASEEEYRNMIEMAPDGIITIDTKGFIQSCNAAVLKLANTVREQVLRKNITRMGLFYKDDLPLIKDTISKTSSRGVSQPLEVRYNQKGEQRKKERWLEAHFRRLDVDNGNGEVQAILHDITARKEIQLALQQSEFEYKRISRLSPLAICTLDRLGFLRSCNPAFNSLTGLLEKEVIGSHFLKLGILDTESVREIRKQLPKLQQDLPQEAIIFPFRKKIGSKKTLKDGFWGEAYITPIKEGRKLTGAQVMIKDITSRKFVHDRMYYMAYHDDMTGLRNRKNFFEHFTKNLSLATRSPSMKIALLLVDLKNFKVINDKHGHPVGDHLLKEVAKRLSGCLRKSDYVFRVGGDEFAILIEKANIDINASAVARKIINDLARPITRGELSFTVSASIGISLYPKDGTTADELVKNAEKALAKARTSIRKPVCFFNLQLNRELEEKSRIERKIQQSLEKNHFILHYQPIVCRDGSIDKYEALLRMQYPGEEVLYPGSFIPFAENTNLIMLIDNWVIFHVGLKLKKIARMKPSPRISVNISGSHFNHPDTVKDIREQCLKSGADPHKINIELTENTLMSDPESAAQKIKKLKKMGFTFSVDDFGSGYSSLSYLKKFPVDELKIDRSLITGITSNQKDRYIISSIIQMTRGLGIGLVVEGVETREQLHVLYELGCTKIQGFYFSRPVPEQKFIVTNKRIFDTT